MTEKIAFIGPHDGHLITAMEQVGPDRFRNRMSKLDPKARVFGGQAVAQALAAAAATVDGRACHSCHSYFLASANAHRPMDFVVERVRDGGTFSVRRVVVQQDGRDIIHFQGSFSGSESGFEHQTPTMPDVPPPEEVGDLLALADMVAPTAPEATGVMRAVAPLDIRFVDPRHFLEGRPEARRQLWVRFVGAEQCADAQIHRQLLAYLSDYWFFGTPLVRHPVRLPGPGLILASLDHSIWFHRHHDADQWLLYDCESPWAGGARGLSRGYLFNLDGQLVATTMQESLLRVVEPAGSQG